MPTPGDVILVNFPVVTGVKPRPGVVVSSPTYHQVRSDVVVGLFTSKVAEATTPADYILQDWRAAGLKVPTAYRSYFTTVEVRSVIRHFGRVSDRDWKAIQARLRLALAVT